MWIELDEELFPPRKALIGLQFSSAADYARAQQLVAADLSVYREVYPYWSMLVVRRTDIGRFASAGLRYTEVEQIDDEDLDPAEVARRDRELIDAWKPILLERLSCYCATRRLSNTHDQAIVPEAAFLDCRLLRNQDVAH